MANAHGIRSRRQHSACTRRGLSFFEFIGCLSALIGGVVLGAMYLGLDPRAMTVALLRQSGLLETSAAKPAEALTAKSAVPNLNPPGETLATASAAQPAESRDAAAAPAMAAPQQFTGPAAGLATALMSPEDLIPLTADQQRVLTRAYWDVLEACMKEEVDNRLATVRDSGNWQLFDYLTGRKQGHSTAAAKIAALKTNGVDAHVTSYAGKAKAWHEDGVKLFSRVVDLLTDAPTAQLSGPFAQSWQSAATQHRMEERLLDQKRQAVLAYLTHTQDGAAGAEPTSGSPAAAGQPAN